MKTIFIIVWNTISLACCTTFVVTMKDFTDKKPLGEDCWPFWFVTYIMFSTIVLVFSIFEKQKSNRDR